jgi:hypothetical protein
MNRTNWWKRNAERRPRTQRPYVCRPRAEELEPRCLLSVTVRPIDEVGNNVDNPNFGAAGTDLIRLSAVAYADLISKPSLPNKSPTFVPSPRTVSNILDIQADPNNPSQDLNTVDQNGLSDFGYSFGQFLDHDMDLTLDGGPAFNIPKDPNQPNDPIGSLLFTRSQTDPATGTSTSNPLQQVNSNTSFIDLSQVYGSTQTVSDALRTFSGGKLKSSPGADGVVGTADDLLPYNTTAALAYNNNQPYFTQAQLKAFNMANDAGLVPSDQLFVAGDRRANETTELISLQTLFMRNHNNLASQLQQSHPDWSDEQIFQEARKLNIAEFQNIVYTGYLPALLGPNAITAYSGYNAGTDSSIANEFSTVAYRFGHSLLNNVVQRHDNTGASIGDISLAENFFDPNLISGTASTDPFGNSSSDIGAVLKGDADGHAQAMDVMAVSNIRNLLFGQGGPGEDLISRDIWRAHDNGIGTYNQVRAGLGLPLITDDATHGFDQITSDPAVQAKLESAYATLLVQNGVPTGLTAGDIDPFAAGLAEDHVSGSDMGPLFTTILANQFTRLRDGDRFFYLNESISPEEQTILDQGSTLGQIISGNTTATNLQADVFRNLSTENASPKGFFTSGSGQAALTDPQAPTMLKPAIYNGLVAALDPNNTGTLALVGSDGNHLSDTFLQTYANVKNFLKSNGGSSMATKLSIQLLTAELNVALGVSNLDPTTSVFVPAVTLPGTTQTLSATLQNSLSSNGVTNPSGITSIQNLLNASITQLNSANPDTTYQEALKDTLDGINNNETVFILNS